MKYVGKIFKIDKYFDDFEIVNMTDKEFDLNKYEMFNKKYIKFIWFGVLWFILNGLLGSIFFQYGKISFWIMMLPIPIIALWYINKDIKINKDMQFMFTKTQFNYKLGDIVEVEININKVEEKTDEIN